MKTGNSTGAQSNPNRCLPNIGLGTGRGMERGGLLHGKLQRFLQRPERSCYNSKLEIEQREPRGTRDISPR